MKKIYLTLILLIATAWARAQSSISVNLPSGNCPPTTASLNVNGLSGTYYVWYYPGGISDTSTTPNHSHLFNTGGFIPLNCSVYDNSWAYLGYAFGSFNLQGVSQIYTSPSNGQVCPNDPINFSLAYPGTNATFTYNFGDGNTITGNNAAVSHSYAVAGTYSVTCTASFPDCPSANTVLNTTVTVQNGLPVTLMSPFNIPQDSICPNDPINAYFQEAQVYDYFIDYGDGFSSNNTLTHGYANVGDYVISLTVFNGCGNSLTATDTVHVSSNSTTTSTPYFQGAYSVCPQTEVFFSTQGTYPNYNWTFGNGDVSTLSYPKTVYSTLGVYPVTLTVTNGCGVSVSYTDSVRVVNNLPVTGIQLTMPDTLCVNQAGIIDFNAGGIQNSYLIDFGNGQSSTISYIQASYSAPGTYTVMGYATNGCGSIDSISHVVNVLTNAPLDQDSYEIFPINTSNCLGDTSVFVIAPAGVGTYNVNFGDGFSSTQPDIVFSGQGGSQYALFKHKYTALGNYNVTSTVTSNCGGQLVKNTEANITQNASLSEAQILYDDEVVLCYQDELNFSAIGGSSYIFDFGDGSPLVNSNLVFATAKHKFSAPGSYTIKVYVSNACGVMDTLEQVINLPDTRITVSTTPINATCGQSNGKVITIVNYAANPPLTYSWTNGDKGLVADSLYSGLYELTVTDKYGCSSRVMSAVSDAQAPTITTNSILNASCSGGNNGSIDINAFGGSAPYTYQWSNGVTAQDVNNLIAGPYELLVTDANGCIAAKSYTITEPNPFNLSFNVVPATCGSSNGQIQTTVMPPSATYNYVWDNGATSANISSLSSGVYHLILLDQNGCIKEEDVVVNNTNGPNVAVDSVSSINCGSSGSSIYTTAYQVAGNNGYTYNWTPGNVTSGDLLNVGPGTYTLTITNSSGCKSIKVVDVEETPMLTNPICIVTVDSTTNTNQVAWEAVNQTGLASFNIYRESSVAGFYYKVGNVHKDSLHLWTDSIADPTVRGWRYKITAVGTCGQESQQSSLHKTIHLTVNAGVGTNWNLIWDNYVGQTHPTFYIWRYTDIFGWEKIDSVASTLFSYTDTNAPVAAQVINYQIEAGPMISCDPTRGPINTSRSNIRSTSARMIGLQDNVTLDNGIYIYPNPSNGIVSFKTSELYNTNISVLVYDALGQVVSNFIHKTNSLTTNVDLNNLSNGIYIVKANINGNLVSKRIVINK